MSAPKTYPPYRVEGNGTMDAFIMDSHGNDVLTLIAMGTHYDEIYGDRIMQIICDALNRETP